MGNVVYKIYALQYVTDLTSRQNLKNSNIIFSEFFYPKMKTLESPLDCKEIKPVNPKGNQSWIFTGRTGAEAETAILWPSDVQSRLTGKDSLEKMLGKIEGRRGRRQQEEMVGWHHWLNWMSLGKLRELVMEREAWYAAVPGDCSPSQKVRHYWVTELNGTCIGHILAFLNEISLNFINIKISKIEQATGQKMQNLLGKSRSKNEEQMMEHWN